MHGPSCIADDPECFVPRRRCDTDENARLGVRARRVNADGGSYGEEKKAGAHAHLIWGLPDETIEMLFPSPPLAPHDQGGANERDRGERKPLHSVV